VSSVGSLRSRFPLEPWYPLKDDRRLAVPPANLVEQPAPTFFGSTAITPAQRFQSVVSFSHSLHLHRICSGRQRSAFPPPILDPLRRHSI